MKRYAFFAALIAACMLISGCCDNAQSEALVQTEATTSAVTTQSTTTMQTTTTTAGTTTSAITREKPVTEPTENTEQARLEKLILDSIPDENRRDEWELIKPIFGDIDGDGAEELIAIYGDPNDREKELGFGNVWFASEDEAVKLSGTWYSDEPLYKIGGKLFLNVMTPGLWGQSYSLIRIAYGNAKSAMPVDYGFCEGWDYDEETQLFTLTLATADPEVSETRKFIFSDYTGKLEAFQELSDSTQYYACRYEQTADYMTGDEFPDKALIDGAREQLLLSDTYKAVYDRAKENLPDGEPLIAANCDHVTPAAYTLPNSGEILKQLPLTDDEREYCEGASVKLLAGKYYCVANLSFEQEDGEFVRVNCEEAWNYGLGERLLPIDPFRIPFADIDYDTVAANAITVE